MALDMIIMGNCSTYRLQPQFLDGSEYDDYDWKFQDISATGMVLRWCLIGLSFEIATPISYNHKS
jgi:hypothetical protein